MGMIWSYAGPIAGKQCVQINEPADPHTWQDNYLCFDQNYAIQWSYAGPIPNKKCTLVNEPSDSAGWDDNYICAPSYANYEFAWSHAGPIPNSCCVQMLEPSDPAANTWTDNFICLKKSAPICGMFVR